MMNYFDLLHMSWSNLYRRKLRTCLTVLGVIIGTASIVVMLSLGLGLQNSMYEQAESSGGLTTITVTAPDPNMHVSSTEKEKDSSQNETRYLTDKVIKEFQELPDVTFVSPVITISGTLTKGNYVADIQLTGMSSEALEQLNLPLSSGSLPQNGGQLELLPGNMVVTNFYDRSNSGGSSFWDEESGAQPKVDMMNDNLFFSFSQDTAFSSDNTFYASSESDAGGEPGQTSATTKTPPKYIVKISGQLQGDTTQWTSYALDVYCNLDNLLSFLKKEAKNGVLPGQPVTSGKKPLPDLVYSSAKVKMSKPEQVTPTMDMLRQMGYEVSSNMEFIESSKKQMAMIQMVLGAIGAISLLVAAIGITNTMMMSIYERTKEIGVMKVLGCSLNNIRQMFLIESGFIGFIGGLIGNILSLLLSLIVNKFSTQMGSELGLSSNISYIPVWLILISTLFAIIIGMIAGYFPARKAMKLSPLNAISNS